MVHLVKQVQLWTHKHYKEIKHWLIVVISITLLVFSMISIAKQNRLISQVSTLAEQNKVLSQQNKQLNVQSKDLGEQNKSIAKQNRAYTACIARIFAGWTRNMQPITDPNLDTCTADSQSQATNNTATGGTPVSSTFTTTPQSASQPAPAETPQTSPTNSLLNCRIDIFGLHLGCS